MSLRKSSIELLKKTPLFIGLREVHTYLSSARRAVRRTEMSDLQQIVAQVGTLLQQPLIATGEPAKTVLLMGMGRVRFIAQESVIRNAFGLAGYRCVVMAPQDRMVIRAYQKLSSARLIFPDKYRPKPGATAKRLLASCKTLDDLTALIVNGVRCGKYAASTLMRKTRSGTFDLSSHEVRHELETALDHSLNCVDTARAILDDVRPDALVLVDRGYSPSGEFFDLCIERNIPVITWNAAHKNDALMLKRYTAKNRDVHPCSLSEKTWKMITQQPWTEACWVALSSELDRCYNSGEWYAEVGTQFNKKRLDREHLVVRLGIDSHKKTAVIFPHIFWDATFFWGHDLFENYEDWFIQTVQAACRNDRLNWIIKVHPANLVKNQRDGVSSEHSEIAAIRKAVGTLPPHVRLLAADTDISTLSLFELMDCCVTVRGTVGIEAACFGVPVLTAGTGRFDRLGFTDDSESREEYLEKLAQAEQIVKPSAYQTELARRYAHAFLLVRPAPLTSIRMRYQQTATADLEVQYQITSAEALRAAPDLNAIAQWIISGDEDYLCALPGVP